MEKALDQFGRLVMQALRDKAFDDADQMLEGQWRAPALQKLLSDLAHLSSDQREVARRLVRSVVDSAIHDFLFALQERADFDGSIRILVSGEDVASQSDGLHGEPFGEDGWQARFSRFGLAPEEA